MKNLRFAFILAFVSGCSAADFTIADRFDDTGSVDSNTESSSDVETLDTETKDSGALDKDTGIVNVPDTMVADTNVPVLGCSFLGAHNCKMSFSVYVGFDSGYDANEAGMIFTTGTGDTYLCTNGSPADHGTCQAIVGRTGQYCCDNFTPAH